MSFSINGANAFANEITKIVVEQGHIAIFQAGDDSSADEETVLYAKRIAMFFLTLEKELSPKDVR